MSEQPEALRLADALTKYLGGNTATQAAAELRRLHEENERLRQINQTHEMKLSVRGYEIQIEDLKAALARRLTDDEIGQIWFAAKIPGLTESDARRLIRAAEEAR